MPFIPNATLEKFGYPETTIRDFKHWAVVVRLQQPTLGSCVIINKSEVEDLGDLEPAAWTEFGTVTKELKRAVAEAFAPDKKNYMALMMVDPQVHFHMLPRYESMRAFANHDFVDRGWPKLPDMADIQPLKSDQVKAIQQRLIDCWPQP